MTTCQSVAPPSGTPMFLDDEYRDIVLLWMLRILGRTKARNGFMRMRPGHDTIAPFIGCDLEFMKSNEGAWFQWIDEKLPEIEKAPPACTGVLFENVRSLSAILGLSPAQEEILAFRALFRTTEPLASLIHHYLDPLTETSLAGLLGVAFGRSQSEVLAALEPDSALLGSGLIRLEPVIAPFRDKMHAMPGVVNALLRKQDSTENLIRFATRHAAAACLAAVDFPHHEKDLRLLMRYLDSASRERLCGVNILLHGKPGIGKTEFARVLAGELGMTLYEVNMMSEAGGALSPQERYAAYLFNQRLFAKGRKALILFDEIEDVMPDPLRTTAITGNTAGYDKAWVNRLLETNPVPAVWVTNRTSSMDAAYLRRFDYVLEMRNPPRSVRRGIAARYLKDFSVTESWLDSQSEREEIAPALLEKAARVVRHAALLETTEVESCLNRIIRNSLEVQGSFKATTYPTPGNYRLEFINTNVDVLGLPASLKKMGKGRLLLHGAPGTGKTAFAHYLARTLDRPLMVRRASDIQSMWVGGTEKNIARMFRDCSDEDAVLLLDEADSFLQDRRQAVRSWEVSHVNELLTQMECFQGIFLCATNFLDHLDTASIRRFGLKVRFDYLTAEQRWAMFESQLGEHGVERLDEISRTRPRRELERLTNLTPGDFAAVRDRIALLGGTATAAQLLEALKEESKLKPDGQKRILGFTG